MKKVTDEMMYERSARNIAVSIFFGAMTYMLIVVTVIQLIMSGLTSPSTICCYLAPCCASAMLYMALSNERYLPLEERARSSTTINVFWPAPFLTVGLTVGVMIAMACGVGF